jgi:hypothetical protein
MKIPVSGVRASSKTICQMCVNYLDFLNFLPGGHGICGYGNKNNMVEIKNYDYDCIDFERKS